MHLMMEYTFHASHWNEEFFEVEKIYQAHAFELLRNQHGHLWTVRVDVSGDAPGGVVCDYNDVQALIHTLDFTFLPLHPLTLGYLAAREGVTVEELMLLPVWGTCGKLEVLLAALTRRLASLIARPGLKQMVVHLYETGPEAARNVKSLSASELVVFDMDGKPSYV